MTDMPQAVVLFGASGFIGRNIVDALSGSLETLIAVTGQGRPVTGCTASFAMSALADIPPLPSNSVIINVAAYRYDAATFQADQSQILDQNVPDRKYRLSLRHRARNQRGPPCEQRGGLSSVMAHTG